MKNVIFIIIFINAYACSKINEEDLPNPQRQEELPNPQRHEKLPNPMKPGFNAN